MNRREFLRTVGATAAAGTALSRAAAESGRATSTLPGETMTSASAPGTSSSVNQQIEATARGKLPMRPLGRTGVQVSLLGFGGGFMHDASDREGIALVDELLDQGINYIDTASSYGKSERLIGEVMKHRRGEAFLATKVLKRSAAEAREEFKRSLERLQTDYVDLLQLHAVNSERELEQVLAPGGALQVALEARSRGQTRFIGITGHKRPEVIGAALERHPFDTVLMPLGLADLHLKSFADKVLPRAGEKGMGVIAMKILGMGRYIPELGVRRCFRYSLNLPVSTGIAGMKNRKELRENLEALKGLTRLSEEELAEARSKARRFANSKILWWKR